MLEQATRSPMLPYVRDFVRDNPHVSETVDCSIYFATFKLSSPESGSDAFKLGGWTEILDEQAAGMVNPSKSDGTRDDGLFNPELAPDDECDTDIRLAVIDVRQWQPVIYCNFMGKFVQYENFIWNNFLFDLWINDSIFDLTNIFSSIGNCSSTVFANCWFRFAKRTNAVFWQICGWQPPLFRLDQLGKQKWHDRGHRQWICSKHSGVYLQWHFENSPINSPNVAFSTALSNLYSSNIDLLF